ncbi:divergent polysaccharide deacetylase family protein [Arhodomonas sp. AD133]|uniref:divergent polysaccharide deacetylase family protein n=1 Tax=Arhodomonas sp. AD133 TaxID=3415009 RepID=UPI003EB9181C
MHRRVGERLGRLLGGLLVLLALPVAAQTPRIAVIIDDLGDRPADLAVADLPGPVTCAILPGSPMGRRIAEAAHAAGKEVILHQPMQAVGDNAGGPRAVDLDMREHAVRRTVMANLAAIPHVAGLNNHRGSLITRHPGHMTWVMRLLAERGDLYFVDSRTTADTVAERMAREQRVPVVRRDVFLDNRREPAAIRERFAELLERARRQGTAVAIGHPYPETIMVLREALARLASRGVTLVPASALTERMESEEETRQWHASWSPSPKAARSSKR